MPRKHHLVPRFYLSGFADLRERIDVINRTTGERHRTRTKKVCVRSGFYAVEDDDGHTGMAAVEISGRSDSTNWHDDVEDLLSEVESETATALRRILREGTFPPSDEDRVVLSTFMALQYLRGGDQREAQEQIADYMTKVMLAGSSPEALRARLRAAREQVNDEELAEYVAFFRATDNYRVVPHQNRHIRMMLETVEEIVPFFYKRFWTLVEFVAPCLATSDCPIALFQDRDGFLPRGGADDSPGDLVPPRPTARLGHGPPARGHR